MNISLVPPTDMVNAIRTWILESLESDNLDNAMSEFPVRIPMFMNDRQITVLSGRWGFDGNSTFYVGYNNPNTTAPHPLDKLGVIAAIAAWVRISGEQEYLDAWERAFSREFFRGTYSIFNGLAWAAAPLEAIAFHPDTRVACRFTNNGESQWLSPNGTPVEVNNEWTTVEAPVPAASA